MINICRIFAYYEFCFKVFQVELYTQLNRCWILAMKCYLFLLRKICSFMMMCFFPHVRVRGWKWILSCFTCFLFVFLEMLRGSPFVQWKISADHGFISPRFLHQSRIDDLFPHQMKASCEWHCFTIRMVGRPSKSFQIFQMFQVWNPN